ncbi:hypothetical protein SBBP2_20047 [Burkholderiales bacterium]|nr:hypothetical protein SBBP2_20047 [Burkholderiales bacterium]
MEQLRWRNGEGATVTGAAQALACATAHQALDDRACRPVGAGVCTGGGALTTKAFRGYQLIGALLSGHASLVRGRWRP